MIAGIMAASLRLRFVVLALAAALLVVGLVRLRDVPVDVLPEFMPPFVEIQTEALGLSAVEVEALITVPLEELLQGVAWLKTMTSESVPGLSSIVLYFEPGTDLLQARQMVQERLTQAQGIPSRRVAKAPVMLQPLSATSRVMMIGLSSSELSLIEMSVLARWNIKPRLMGVPGVANVAVWGQRERQLQVQVDPQRLRDEGLTLQQIIETAGEALWVSPLTYLNASTPGSGGWIDTPNQRLAIRHLLPIGSPDDLARVSVVGREGALLGDVTELVEDHQPLIGDAIVGGAPGLLLVVEKFPGENTVQVTRDVESALEALRLGLPGVDMHLEIFRPASFIESAARNLATVFLIGLALAFLAMLAFHADWRAGLVNLAAVALSFTAALLVLHLRGATLNAMALVGFVLALVIVLDDAGSDVENIARRLRRRRREGDTRSMVAILLEASLKTRVAAVFATLIALLIVLPLFFLGGSAAPFLRPLAFSYALAMLASLVVALTVTPALSLALLARPARAESGEGGGVADAPRTQAEPRLGGWLRNAYARLAPRFVERPWPLYLTIAVVALVGIVAVPGLQRSSLLPNFRERNLLVHLSGSPGTSHPAMMRLVQQVAAELEGIEGVREVAAHVGRAITADQVVGISEGELWLALEPDADYDATMEAILAAVAEFPSASHGVRTYLQEITEGPLSPAPSDIVVRVYGHNLATLQEKAREIGDALIGVAGITGSRVETQVEEAVVEIEVDMAAAAVHGLKPGDVRRAAATLVNGIEVGYLFEEQKVFDVMVVGTADLRHSLSSVRALLIDTPGGGHVRLDEVADIRIAPTPNVINREGASRRIDVQADVQGRDLAAVARDVEAVLQGIEFPLEYHAEVQGEYAERLVARRNAWGVTVAAVLGILLLLQAAFGSWRLAGLAFLTLPAALVGGVLAAYAGGGVLSLGSLVGFLTVLGIAARNGIMLISHYQHLESQEGESFGPALVLRGAKERTVPIVMTATTTGLALLPLVIAGNIAGLELLRPMAIVILGGLVTSTMLNLFILPALYLRFRAQPDTEFAPFMGTPMGRIADATN